MPVNKAARRILASGILLLVSTVLDSAPLYFRTSTRAASCFSPGGPTKEIKNFYTSKLPPEEKEIWIERLSSQEAKSLWQSLDCVYRLKLSKEEKFQLLEDHQRHQETRELLFSYYENHLLSEERTLRFSAFEEKSVKNFLSAKKELLSRLYEAERTSLSEKPLPVETFANLYLALLLQHWEFFQTAPEFLKESLNE
ncbi:hypothetical protein LEP1GSC047_1173 [Leptospira inadai serovar Lyme str. 10]|uniref:Uncharacterized protein n=2 Tax=Leptospira inadai serovar Lyme TaxID=293084 RepID=V6H908_9LEPT|nr:hypothetical protein [Leptospira inadai]EQA35521.1 hypothetical protein LEP1GSC047_1173 [Leptospira inadai serovar Lyme str. 10]PNV75919.1 hypothetical protein BES34_005260 [Leptospira inadai serovar Lyme]